MKRMDLNLLAALDALLRERSVSRAAITLGLGQPAMSAALARLRALFGDELLVRTSKGMEPTPRARALAQPLHDALSDLRALIETGEVFDPIRSKRTFRLSGGDYVGMTVLPPLLANLRLAAPGIDLRFRYVEKDRIQACLDNEEIDLALFVADALPTRFTEETLFEERFVCAVRDGHPLLAKANQLRAFARADHLLVTERGDQTGVVDRKLAEHGLSRRVALTVPSASLVPDILRSTNLVATVGERAANRMRADGGVAIFPPPLRLAAWRMRMVGLARNGRDEGLIWLRQMLRTAAPTLD
jgi:DNA-binding transcriptional LysR family regulator